MESLLVYAADIGSVAKGKFGWARVSPRPGDPARTRTSTDIRQLAQDVAADLDAGIPVALGLECPLFVPLRDDPLLVTSGRRGESNRPWSAGAGAAVLAAGLTEAIWVLREVRRQVHKDVPAFLDWIAFTDSGRGLFLWEAFVTAGAKAETHVGDAEIAVRCFADHLPNIPAANAIEETSVYSLIGAALLRTGWSTDLRLLETPCVVIRA